jgi:tetratricopeptide (TPR) repeat protein
MLETYIQRVEEFRRNGNFRDLYLIYHEAVCEAFNIVCINWKFPPEDNPLSMDVAFHELSDKAYRMHFDGEKGEQFGRLTIMLFADYRKYLISSRIYMQEPKKLFNVIETLAHLYYRVGDFKSAFMSIEEARNTLNVLDDSESTRLQTPLFTLMAELYHKQENYSLALEWRWEALNNFMIYGKHRHDELFDLFILIAEEYMKADDPNRAVEVYERALSVRKKMLKNERRKVKEIQDTIIELQGRQVLPDSNHKNEPE